MRVLRFLSAQGVKHNDMFSCRRLVFTGTCIGLRVIHQSFGETLTNIHAILAVRNDRPNFIGALLIGELESAWSLERGRQLFIHKQVYSSGTTTHVADNTDTIGKVVDEITVEDD